MNLTQLQTVMKYNELCDLVLLERRRLELSQQDLADKAEVSRGTIINIERKKNVYFDSMEKVLHALGKEISINDITNVQELVH